MEVGKMRLSVDKVREATIKRSHRFTQSASVEKLIVLESALTYLEYQQINNEDLSLKQRNNIVLNEQETPTSKKFTLV
jgi:hypothetical protein